LRGGGDGSDHAQGERQDRGEACHMG
jgi:hypothetical protein